MVQNMKMESKFLNLRRDVIGSYTMTNSYDPEYWLTEEYEELFLMYAYLSLSFCGCGLIFLILQGIFELIFL